MGNNMCMCENNNLSRCLAKYCKCKHETRKTLTRKCAVSKPVIASYWTKRLVQSRTGGTEVPSKKILLLTSAWLTSGWLVAPSRGLWPHSPPGGLIRGSILRAVVGRLGESATSWGTHYWSLSAAGRPLPHTAVCRPRPHRGAPPRRSGRMRASGWGPRGKYAVSKPVISRWIGLQYMHFIFLITTEQHSKMCSPYGHARKNVLSVKTVNFIINIAWGYKLRLLSWIVSQKLKDSALLPAPGEGENNICAFSDYIQVFLAKH